MNRMKANPVITPITYRNMSRRVGMVSRTSDGNKSVLAGTLRIRFRRARLPAPLILVTFSSSLCPRLRRRDDNNTVRRLQSRGVLKSG